ARLLWPMHPTATYPPVPAATTNGGPPDGADRRDTQPTQRSSPDLPARGVEVEFFGAKTTMPPGPALLAIRSGAPLYAADMWYEPEGARSRLNGPLPVPPLDAGPLTERIRLMTQDMADIFADGIRRHPEDWHMLQRMWR